MIPKNHASARPKTMQPSAGMFTPSASTTELLYTQPFRLSRGRLPISPPIQNPVDPDGSSPQDENRDARKAREHESRHQRVECIPWSERNGTGTIGWSVGYESSTDWKHQASQRSTELKDFFHEASVRLGIARGNRQLATCTAHRLAITCHSTTIQWRNRQTTQTASPEIAPVATYPSTGSNKDSG